MSPRFDNDPDSPYDDICDTNQQEHEVGDYNEPDDESEYEYNDDPTYGYSDETDPDFGSVEDES